MAHQIDALNRQIPWQRKAESWDGPAVTTAEVLMEAAKLPEFPAGGDPCECFEDGPRPQFFVAVCKNGDRFLVDTQGYDYARYIARLPRMFAELRFCECICHLDPKITHLTPCCANAGQQRKLGETIPK